VERNPENFVLPGLVEIWKLSLDGSGRFERLTHFTDYAGCGASNPVISDDGRFMAFQLKLEGTGHGYGRGLFLYDFEKAAAVSHRN
jgi:Tol biopolymer transport system component